MIEVPGVAVVVAHEGLGAAEDGALGVAELGGDDALEAEGELIAGAAGLVVEFVTDVVEEVVGVFDFAVGGGGEEACFDEFAEVGATAFDVGDPEEVMVVAEAAAALLDVGFLEEDGAGVFLVAVAEVLAAEFEERFLVFLEAVAEEACGEGLEEFGVAGDVACVHEGGFVFLISLGLFDAFGDGAAGLADFEADVPEEVEDFLDEGGEVFGEFVGGAREEEEEVDIGAWVEGVAAVATDCGEGEDGGFLAFGEGEVEEGFEDDVEEFGAGACDFEATGTGAVAEFDAVFLDFEEAFVEGDALCRREEALGGRFEGGAGVGLEGLEVERHVVLRIRVA